MAKKITDKKIKKEMLEQLRLKGKFSSYNCDLVDSYIYQFNLKRELQEDIDKEGLRIKTTSGNGFETSKPNESVERLKKCNELMLNIITKLGLDTELIQKINSEDEYL